MIIYGAPLVFFLGTILIHYLRSRAPAITLVLQSIAVFLGCVLAVGLAARFPDAGSLEKGDAIKWTGSMNCASDMAADERSSFARLVHDYDLNAN